VREEERERERGGCKYPANKQLAEKIRDSAFEVGGTHGTPARLSNQREREREIRDGRVTRREGKRLRANNRAISISDLEAETCPSVSINRHAC
jgi:hypothetical protein